MLKRLLVAAIAGLVLMAPAATPAFAIDLESLSDAERAAFRAEIRAYLLENPEVLMEAIAVLEERELAASAERDAARIAALAPVIYNSPDDWVGGNPEGDITLVEFLDYRCGFCRRAAPEVAELLESDGNVRLVVKEFPILGEQSILAARFALSARALFGDAAYETLHVALMSMRSDVTETSLTRLAGDLGLDGDAILDGITAPEIDRVIEANYALAQELEISGTPSFILGGTLVRGFLPFEDMAYLVEEARAAAE